MINKKVILVGHFGVGKTSLVRQFVHQKFSDNYLTTIGVKIDKKVVTVDQKEVNIVLWDIAGEDAMKKIPASYKLGAHGILYVFDVTRPTTYKDLDQHISELRMTLPDAPLVKLANKSDMLTESMKSDLTKELDFSEVLFTSAKTGENVEAAFENLTKEMIQ